MCSADLARTGQATAAADKARLRDAVMRAPERSREVERAAGLDLAEQAADLSHLERFVELQRRQDAGQAAGHHRLARARRAAEEQVVTTRRGDLERSPGGLLPDHLPEVLTPNRGRLLYRHRLERHQRRL